MKACLLYLHHFAPANKIVSMTANLTLINNLIAGWAGWQCPSPYLSFIFLIRQKLVLLFPSAVRRTNQNH
jgi:hypothetical protein